MTRRTLGAGAALLVALTCASPRADVPPAPDPQALAALWDRERVSPPLPPLMDHAEVVRRVQALRRRAPDLFHVEEIGRSVEGRSLNYVRVGSGDRGVLLWSQMHGDEPTATAALFDLFEYLRRHRDEEVPRRILSNLTLHVVPMLNPDGAERFERRNAQGIDINRDALRLQTPEGRALKALRDRLNPAVGFNLHNQNWRTSVGRPPQPAAISLLSVAFDEAKSDSPGRRLTRQVCAVIRDALEPLAAGRIGRYPDDFEVRAFGDNITRWGTPVVLIETGPWPGPNPDAALVRLNFVALVAALDALATGRVEQADPARYETLPLNEGRLFYLLVRGATVVNGAGIPPFVADIGISATRRVRVAGGRRELVVPLTIEDLGDLRVNGALETIDAEGLTVAPLFDRRLAPGAIVALPDWRARPARRRIAVGQRADLVLLAPAGSGRYKVVRAIRGIG
ncbi:MAG TPA: M14 family metallopeptidase [Vicinamibacterales bacterium]|nr:M14 family metallopeptidase [Vicinamibacterales bacterium]